MAGRKKRKLFRNMICVTYTSRRVFGSFDIFFAFPYFEKTKNVSQSYRSSFTQKCRYIDVKNFELRHSCWIVTSFSIKPASVFVENASDRFFVQNSIRADSASRNCGCESVIDNWNRSCSPTDITPLTLINLRNHADAMTRNVRFQHPLVFRLSSCPYAKINDTLFYRHFPSS